MAETTYINGLAIREHIPTNSQYPPVLNLAVYDVEEFCNVLRDLSKDNHVKLCICRRREEGKRGETHYMKLDTFVPRQRAPDDVDQRPDEERRQPQSRPPQQERRPPAVESKPATGGDDKIPF